MFGALPAPLAACGTLWLGRLSDGLTGPYSSVGGATVWVATASRTKRLSLPFLFRSLPFACLCASMLCSSEGFAKDVVHKALIQES